jgi:hypothetical protein
MAIKSSVIQLELVLKCDILYLPEAIMLFPLHRSSFCQVTISFCADFQVDTIGKRCSTVAVAKSANVPR